MKILVTKFRNLGDVLLSTPVFKSLKHIYPDSELHVAVNDFCTQIVADHPDVDKVITYKRLAKTEHSLLKRIGYEICFYKQFVNQYDLVINLTEGDRGCIISALSGASRRLGYLKKPTLIHKLARFDTTFDSQEELHTVQKDLQFAAALDPEKIDRTVTLGWNQEHEAQVNDLLKSLNLTDNFVIVHPVSRWMFKCWKPEYVAKTIDHIQRRWQKPVLLTTSDDPKEKRMAVEITALCVNKPLELPEQLNLQAYACLVAKASLFFGIDSAPMHIAASTNTPVLALFGASKPDLWGPWDNESGSTYQRITALQINGRHRIVSNNNLEIFYEGEKKLSRGMMAIELEQVVKALDEVMETLISA